MCNLIDVITEINKTFYHKELAYCYLTYQNTIQFYFCTFVLLNTA